MSILSDLEAACDELDAARTEFDKPMPVSDVEFFKRKVRQQLATSNVQKLATDDTIAALVAVAEAAIDYQREHPCGPHDGCRVPCKSLDDLSAALAPLVKEADDE